MSDLFFTGEFDKRKTGKPVDLPWQSWAGSVNVEGYIVEEGLRMAVNVALVLGRPLLLTGDPGTGKTELAYVIAAELGLGVVKFVTKSTSVARDLFYSFDSLGRFYAAQTGMGSGNPLDYISFCALGEAILQANEREKVAHVLPAAFKHDGPKRSLMLIDEIEKAPRDFPNDLLNEIEKMQFIIPELGNATVDAPKEYKPVVIITSNSEKPLPDAFLRRCAFYHIDFPKLDMLKKIVISRGGDYLTEGKDFVDDIIAFFMKLRDPGSGIQKKPATAELLDWILTLKRFSKNPNPVRDIIALRHSLPALIKNTDDLVRAYEITGQWEAGK
jgi:MoxR-like ATPase